MTPWKRLVLGFLVVLTAVACRPQISALKQVDHDGPVEITSLGGSEVWRTLTGVVDFGDYHTQATIPEIADASTVSLIRSDTGVTIACTVTNPGGSFSLQFGHNFAPVPDKTYLLKAIKDLSAGGAPNRVGAEAARIRAVIQFLGGGWQPLTSDSVTLNRTTTALAIILDLRGIDPKTHIGSLRTGTKAPSGADSYTAPAGSTVT